MDKYIPEDNVSYNNISICLEKIKVVEDQLPNLPDEKTEESDAMDTEIPQDSDKMKTVLPELEVYIFNLTITTLLKYDLTIDAAWASTMLIERVTSFNRRSMDIISSKSYFYYSLAHEKLGRLADIRAVLLKLYRTTCIRRDEMGQAVLLNLILRNFLYYNLVDGAKLFSSRTNFPENASNNQFCRFLYYMGRIHAVQTDYVDSYKRLMWAARKAPQEVGVAFLKEVNKLTIIVQLLMGEIPERTLFNQEEFKHSLKPYLELTKAVRHGDMNTFSNVVNQFKSQFHQDKNFSLVQRLSHNVLKAGLRKISISYSRILLDDIATKLALPKQGMEYICAKAIRDGVIDATIDSTEKVLLSNEAIDVYSTEEPQKAFHARIGFCLDVHNDAIKAMRYPPDAYKVEKKKVDDEPEEGEKTIEELIREMEEDDED